MNRERLQQLADCEAVLREKVGDDPAGRLALDGLLTIVDQLDEESTIDSLTRLPNRHVFDAMLETGEIPGADIGPSRKRRAAEKKAAPAVGYALLLVDLDRFKAVNDTYGHPQGDRVLKMAGFSLRMALRRTDTLFRIGGDEFASVLALHDRAHLEDAAPVAASIQRRYQEEVSHLIEFGFDNRYLSTLRRYYRLPNTLTDQDRASMEILGASFGIVPRPVEDADLNEMFATADAAMYAAKASRKAAERDNLRLVS